MKKQKSTEDQIIAYVGTLSYSERLKFLYAKNEPKPKRSIAITISDIRHPKHINGKAKHVSMSAKDGQVMSYAEMYKVFTSLDIDRYYQVFTKDQVDNANVYHLWDQAGCDLMDLENCISGTTEIFDIEID